MASEIETKPTAEELQARIDKARRALVLMPNAVANFDPLVISSSIDAIARLLIEKGIITEAEIRLLQLEAQATLMESMVSTARTVVGTKGGWLA